MTIKVNNQFTTPGVMPAAYEETPDGFLRVKAHPLKEGILPYGRHELGDLPPELDGVDPILMLVGMDAISSGETLRSLEAARITAPEHIWVTPDNAEVQKGSAAGAASIVGPYQEIDLLITDEDTINGIKARELGELSGGYHAETVFEPGEWNGQPYHMKQVGIIYNHIAILHPGEGRGGSDIRIINHKGGSKMAIVKVKLANTGRYVNVEEDTARHLEEEHEASEKKVKNAEEERDAAKGEAATSGAKVEELMAQVGDLNGQMASLKDEADEAKGELSVYKEKLDELLSDEAQEANAAQMVEESSEADEIIENACGDDEKKKEEIRNSIGRIGNTGIYKLRGVALMTAVLNSIGRDTAEMSSGEIRGSFRTHHHLAITNKGKAPAKTVSGHSLFQNNNGASVSGDAKARVSKMWGKKG